MNSEFLNLYLFFRAIAKILLMTGLGPAIVWATLRASRTQFEIRIKFRGRQLAQSDGLIPAISNRATSLPRKFRRYA